LAAERGTSKSRGSAARPGRQAPGVLTTTVPTVLEQHGCRTSEQRAVAGARRCPFYVSPSVFLTSRCGVQVQVQVPSPLNSHYAECLEEGVEDWKTGSLQGEDDSCNCRHRTTREQMIPKSKQSNITSVSMSRIGLSLQPTPRLCRAVSKDFWKQRIAQAQSASAPRSRLDPIPNPSANLRVSVNFEDSSASLVGCFDLIGLVQGLIDRPELSHYPWLHGYYK
jgi:hypothetical protein